MRRVLFLAYYFPPIGGAGAQRPAAFARYLPDYGYEPVVITGPAAVESRWAPQDRALAASLGESIEVRRVPAPEPSPSSGGWSGRAERWLRRRSQWRSWWVDGAVTAGASVEGVDLVYAWMSPFESAEAAAALAAKHDRRWVADLGDPWALDEMMVYPSALHRRLETRAMRRGLGGADAIVMSTAEAARRVERLLPTAADRVVVAIPNGFDGADFVEPVTRPSGEPFRIVHTGYLHTELGLRQRRRQTFRRLLGCEVPGVDFLTRSHVHLLEAVKRLLSRRPELQGRIEVVLAGALTEVDRRVAEDAPFARLLGYVPHDRTVELVRTADLLFLPMYNLPPGRRAGIVPGKTYEYLAAGPPILAAVPDGDVRDILEAAGGCYLCRPDDVSCLERSIEAAYRTRELPSHRDVETVAQYEYRTLARRLAAVFDRVVAKTAA